MVLVGRAAADGCFLLFPKYIRHLLIKFLYLCRDTNPVSYDNILFVLWIY